MSFYEECLTLGQYLSQAEKVALYEFLLSSKRRTYENQARNLLKVAFLESCIANGAIEYKVFNNIVSYKCRENGTQESLSTIRELSLGRIRYWNTKKLVKFFAQSEVDVLSNFPLPGVDQNPESSFTFNSSPYYDLNHFSNGRGKILGLVKKIEQRDSEILMKLRTL
jgi:hypothetical protein